MNWTKVFVDTFNDSASTIFKLVIIIIPLLIIIECFKDIGWLEKISKRAEGITKFFKLPGEAALGITVGLLIGLTFGSGVIMQIKEEVKLSKFQLNILLIFIGICHALIEETIVYAVIGANWGLLLINRIMAALIFTYGYIGTVQLISILREKKRISKVDV